MLRTYVYVSYNTCTGKSALPDICLLRASAYYASLSGKVLITKLNILHFQHSQNLQDSNLNAVLATCAIPFKP